MDPRRFDALTKAFVGALPRRRLLRRLGGSGLGALLAVRGGRARATQDEANTVSLPCAPCNCDGDQCDCCLIGITGGGVARTPTGAANLALFATELAAADPNQAAGFVRWVDPAFAGVGITLESVGAVTYFPVPGQEGVREVRGTMQANGEGEHPFVLRVVDAGPDALGQDTAALAVGDRAAEGGTTSGFGYAADGTLVGGDIQLLSDVAPIQST